MTDAHRLFSLAAIMTRRRSDGSIDINHAHGFRIATDGEDAVVGRYVQYLMGEHPGFSLSGKISVMEISQEDLRPMWPLPPPDT